MKKTVLLLQRFDHHDGNGTTTHYPPGSTGAFEEPLANALVYEGMGSFAADEVTEEVAEEKSEGDAPANKAKKAAPANKAKKAE